LTAIAFKIGTDVEGQEGTKTFSGGEGKQYLSQRRGKVNVQVGRVRCTKDDEDQASKLVSMFQSLHSHRMYFERVLEI